MSKARLNIFGSIGMGWDGTGVTTESVAKDLQAFPSDTDEIECYIASPGGEIFTALAVLNMLKRHSAKKTCYVDGLAASAASIVAMAGDKIIIGEGSMMMIHNASGLTIGTAEDHEQQAATLHKMDAEMAAIYARRSGMKKTEVEKMMNDETWLSGPEAVAAGLANECAPMKEEDKPAASAAVGALKNYHYRNCTPQIIAALQNTVSPSGVTDKPAPIAQAEQRKEAIIMASDTPRPEATPTAATFEEISNICGEGENAFIVAQLKAKATPEQSRSAWTAELKRQRDEALAAKAKAESEKPVAKAPGVEPLGNGLAPTAKTGADPEQMWAEAVSAEVAKGKPKAQAIAAVVARDPELHAAYLAAYNAEHGKG